MTIFLRAAPQGVSIVSRGHGLAWSVFYRCAAEQHADELTDADLTTKIDDAIDAVGQPGDESVELRRTVNSRVAEVPDEW